MRDESLAQISMAAGREQVKDFSGKGAPANTKSN
jgi:hypothetical protein